MGWLQRLARIFRQKSNAALSAADDPVEALDLVYYEQSELLAKSNGDLATVLAAEKRLERECEQLAGQADRYDSQAREALAGGDEHRARLMIGRYQSALGHREAMGAQLADVRARRMQFEKLVEEIRSSVERLRLRRQAASAQATLSNAVISANEHSLPIGARGAQTALSLSGASEKLTDLRSRAESLMELRKSGRLDPVGASEFDLHVPDEAVVERRLAELKSSAGQLNQP